MMLPYLISFYLSYYFFFHFSFPLVIFWDIDISAFFLFRYAVATPSSGGQVNTMKPKAMSNVRWRRVVFKISGTALTGSSGNIDPKVCVGMYVLKIQKLVVPWL